MAASRAVYFMHGNVYVWVSLVAQTEKNLPAMQETWVQSLGSLSGYSPWGPKESDVTE